MKTAGMCYLLMISGLAVKAVIIDRVAIVMDNAVIKDSDIERDLRIVDYLNHERLAFDLGARKKAASRLIDQLLIRREVEVGDYQIPAQTEADKLLAATQKDRGQNAESFKRSLAQYRLTPDELKDYLYWQLTVLRFIEQRFRAGAQVTDDEVRKYYDAHSAEFAKANAGKGKSFDEAALEIRDNLAEEQVTKAFDNWLRGRRRATRIEYREESLK